MTIRILRNRRRGGAVAGNRLAARQAQRSRIAGSEGGPNGIAESRYVRIGGIDQWVQIRGENTENPVLFVLHGGPASYKARATF